jgi:thioredoxin reductase (NADPH)
MADIVRSKLLIIGGGPAGYTAALYAARARLEPVCIEGYAAGGQIARSGRIDNFPGQLGGISGAELGDRIRNQALEFGAAIETDEVESVDLSGPPFEVRTAEHDYAADAVIVATGARSRRLQLPSEDEYEGRGVCYCAICDGPFFADQQVVVVGGGDAAVEEALALSKIATNVVLVHRRRQFRANASIQSAVASTSNIRMVTPAAVAEILGEELGVTGVRLRDEETGEETVVPTDGVFVAIGHEPASGMFTPWLEVDEYGFLRTSGGTATRVPGVFAAGDVADPRYRQAVTAAASGCAAAIDAERWLMSRAAGRVVAAGAALLDVEEKNLQLDTETTVPAEQITA